VRILPLLLPVLACSAYEIGGPIIDLRLQVGVVSTPDILEETSLPGNASTSFDWDGAKKWAPAFEVLWMEGASINQRGNRGFIWGAGVHVLSTNQIPDDYTATIDNLLYRQVGLVGAAGYATRPKDSEFGEWHFEALGMVRGGGLQAETAGADGTGGLKVEGGYGYWWEVAPQVGAYLADDGWLLGFAAEWRWGQGAVSIDGFADNSTHDLTYRTSGPGAWLVLGWRM